MKKKELMEYVGKDVTITLNDGTIYGGVLQYTTAKVSRTRNWFILGGIAFKASYVKRFEKGYEE